VTDLWNNPNFNPSTSLRPHVHDRYEKAISLNYSKIANVTRVTPKMIEIIFEEMHTMLMGPYHWSYSEDKANSEERKQKFLEQYPPYILYVWEFLVEHELQRSFLHRVMFFQPEIKIKRKRPHEDAFQTVNDALVGLTQVLKKLERQREIEAKNREIEAKRRATERHKRREAKGKLREERKDAQMTIIKLETRLLHCTQERTRIMKDSGQENVSPSKTNLLEQSFQSWKEECTNLEEEIKRLEEIVHEKRIAEILL
jgi:hypothetical protein